MRTLNWEVKKGVVGRSEVLVRVGAMQERGRVGIQALFFLDAIMRNALAYHKRNPELMGLSLAAL